MSVLVEATPMTKPPLFPQPQAALPKFVLVHGFSSAHDAPRLTAVCVAKVTPSIGPRRYVIFPSAATAVCRHSWLRARFPAVVTSTGVEVIPASMRPFDGWLVDNTQLPNAAGPAKTAPALSQRNPRPRGTREDSQAKPKWLRPPDRCGSVCFHGGGCVISSSA